MALELSERDEALNQLKIKYLLRRDLNFEVGEWGQQSVVKRIHQKLAGCKILWSF